MGRKRNQCIQVEILVDEIVHISRRFIPIDVSGRVIVIDGRRRGELPPPRLRKVMLSSKY